jgi:hypothetical protein
MNSDASSLTEELLDCLAVPILAALKFLDNGTISLTILESTPEKNHLFVISKIVTGVLIS